MYTTRYNIYGVDITDNNFICNCSFWIEEREI